MIEFFFESGLFATKVFVVALLFGALLFAAIASVMRQTAPSTEHIEVTKLNERLKQEKETLLYAAMDQTAAVTEHKLKRQSEKAERKARKKALKGAKEPPSAHEPEKPRVYVVDFDGDIQASQVSHLRRVLTAVLSVATPHDEVVVRLDSSGGVVHGYGLSASQLERVKQKGIPLTVCVDKVAASGGYMMACVANQIVAAPFAIIGSIGVVAQLPNFHRLLKKNDVDFELLTAGQYKRTLTMFGENTAEGRQKFREDLEDTHQLFKEHIVEQRPSVDIDKVATGEVWLGKRAKELNLIDQLMTSDQYLMDACERAEVLLVKHIGRKNLQERLSGAMEEAATRVFSRVWENMTRRYM